jgi:hypothetical protein
MTRPMEDELRRHLAEWADLDIPPLPDVAEIASDYRSRAARRRAVAAAVAALVVAIAGTVAVVVSLDDRGDPRPVGPVTPTPTTKKTQSPDTWVDTPVTAATEAQRMEVTDPLQDDRDAWFEVVVDHLDPGGRMLEKGDSARLGLEFGLPAAGSDLATGTPETSGYSTDGRIGLLASGSGLDPLDGCRYLAAGPPASNGTESCNDERLSGPHGERAVVARYERRCGAYEGGGPAPAVCGDYRVSVGVERQDGRIGFVRIEGRGTPDYNPFTPAALAAAAADPRVTLPDAAFTMPTNRAVTSVTMDHLPGFRPQRLGAQLEGYPGNSFAAGRRGPLSFYVDVRLAGDPPRCGRSYLLECVERRVYGATDPTTVLVGAWDDEDWASCCPRSSRAGMRAFAYVGPRHTVTVTEMMIVKEGEPPIGDDLDRVLIDLALDPRLQ